MDADDISSPTRVSLQLEEAIRLEVPAIVGMEGLCSGEEIGADHLQGADSQGYPVTPHPGSPSGMLV